MHNPHITNLISLQCGKKGVSYSYTQVTRDLRWPFPTFRSVNIVYNVRKIPGLGRRGRNKDTWRRVRGDAWKRDGHGCSTGHQGKCSAPIATQVKRIASSDLTQPSERRHHRDCARYRASDSGPRAKEEEQRCSDWQRARSYGRSDYSGSRIFRSSSFYMAARDTESR